MLFKWPDISDWSLSVTVINNDCLQSKNNCSRYLRSLPCLLASLWSQAFQREHKKINVAGFCEDARRKLPQYSLIIDMLMLWRVTAHAAFESFSFHLIKLRCFLSYERVFWIFESLVSLCTLQEQCSSSSEDFLFTGIVTFPFNQTSLIL